MKKQILISALIMILLVGMAYMITSYTVNEKEDTLNDIPTNIQQIQKDYPDSVVIKFIPVPTGKLINKTVIFKGKEIILKNAPEYKKVANYSVKYDKLSFHLLNKTQEQNNEIADLKEEIEEITERLDSAGIKS